MADGLYLNDSGRLSELLERSKYHLEQCAVLGAMPNIGFIRGWHRNDPGSLPDVYKRQARTIAEYIPDNSSIFLTLGTTVEVIAYALLERSGLMVITNNVVAALTLNKKTDFEVVLASGYMRKSSNGLVGESTIEFVNGFQCDYVITSTGGISEADGHLLDYHTADVSVAQCMMRNACLLYTSASFSEVMTDAGDAQQRNHKENPGDEDDPPRVEEERPVGQCQHAPP